MRILSLLGTIILAATSASAIAGETKGEIRGGGIANNDGAALLVGAGIGHDWSVGEKLFIGVQATGEVDVGGSTGIIAGVGRFGPKLGERSRLFVLGGVAALPDYGNKSMFPVVGAGAEIGFGKKLYGKLEYRIFPGSNEDHSEGNSGSLNQISIGLGMRF